MGANSRGVSPSTRRKANGSKITNRFRKRETVIASVSEAIHSNKQEWIASSFACGLRRTQSSLRSRAYLVGDSATVLCGSHRSQALEALANAGEHVKAAGFPSSTSRGMIQP